VAKNRAVAIAASLDMLAQVHDKKIKPDVVKAYAASLEDLLPSQIIQAFSRALDEAKFMPFTATLREYSGRPVSGDPIASEAREELFRIWKAIHKRPLNLPRKAPKMSSALLNVSDLNHAVAGECGFRRCR
jgi:hypothetical protein